MSRTPAFCVSQPHRTELVDIDVADPAPGQVVADVVATGICGSDLEVVDGIRPEAYVRYPVILGHEWVGKVTAVGTGVTGLQPGDGIVAEGLYHCGTCPRCAEGRTNLCMGSYEETGFTKPGAMAELVAVPASHTHALPSAMTTEVAALLEPAACVAGGLLEVGYPKPGSRVAVMGDGPLGQLATMLVQLARPSELVVVGRRAARRQQAVELGATTTVDGDDADAIADLAGRFDMVVEATNSSAGIASALALPRRGGTAVLLGVSGALAPAIPPDLMALGHLRVQGVFAASKVAWQHVVDLYTTGQFEPAPLISHRFALGDTDAALATLRDKDAGAMKVLIQPNR